MTSLIVTFQLQGFFYWLNFKTSMKLRMSEEGKAGFGLEKLRLSCDIQ